MEVNTDNIERYITELECSHDADVPSSINVLFACRLLLDKIKEIEATLTQATVGPPAA